MFKVKIKNIIYYYFCKKVTKDNIFIFSFENYHKDLNKDICFELVVPSNFSTKTFTFPIINNKIYWNSHLVSDVSSLPIELKKYCDKFVKLLIYV